MCHRIELSIKHIEIVLSTYISKCEETISSLVKNITESQIITKYVEVIQYF